MNFHEASLANCINWTLNYLLFIIAVDHMMNSSKFYVTDLVDFNCLRKKNHTLLQGESTFHTWRNVNDASPVFCTNKSRLDCVVNFIFCLLKFLSVILCFFDDKEI
jgi:hypothetical protein